MFSMIPASHNFSYLFNICNAKTIRIDVEYQITFQRKFPLYFQHPVY